MPMVPNHDRIESILMAALEIESDIDRRAYLRQIAVTTPSFDFKLNN